jgi:hypothetical protein
MTSASTPVTSRDPRISIQAAAAEGPLYFVNAFAHCQFCTHEMRCPNLNEWMRTTANWEDAEMVDLLRELNLENAAGKSSLKGSKSIPKPLMAEMIRNSNSYYGIQVTQIVYATQCISVC